jgi:hypothetical protein
LAKIKFYKFYSSLEKSGRKEFKKFIASPYFNNGRDYSPIINEIEKKLTRELKTRDFVNSISENLKYSQRAVWNRLSELMKLSETYAAFKALEKRDDVLNNLVASYYLSGSQYELFEQKTAANLRNLNKSKIGLDSTYQFYELFQQQGYFYIFTNKLEPFVQNLNDRIIYHSASYIMNHYLHLTELLHQSRLTSTDMIQKGLNFLTDENTENFISILSDEPERLKSLVSFHYYIYRAFFNIADDSFYYVAKEMFKRIKDVLNDEYKAMAYQLLTNYCIEKTNKNEPSYYGELFEIYNQKLDERIFQDLQVGNFPINNFRDYIFVALQLGKISWIKDFISKYSYLLPESVRDDEINLSYGIVYYHESDSAKALEYLNRVAGDNYIHYTDSKYYKLRLYYEKSMYEEAFLEIDNYRQYIRSHKEIPEQFKKNFTAFIREYTKLLKMRTKDDKEAASVLKKELLSLPQTGRRKWIISRLEEIV